MPRFLKSLERLLLRPLVHRLRPARHRGAAPGSADEELLVALVRAELRRGGAAITVPEAAGRDLDGLVRGLLAAGPPPAHGIEAAGRGTADEPVAGSVGPATRWRRAA
ncbi:MAG: hypothetical protein ACKO9B_05930 [Planctomycetota bacterium]|nr:hypothetical protein [Planctomycetota bacterium]